jgi:hypothetical protein
MNAPASRAFNAVAATLSANARKALIEAMWSGAGQLLDEASGQAVAVLPDRAPQDGEHLFYVSFLGSTRDAIPSQHYMIPAPDDRTAVMRAHELYEKEPRRRKGSSLRLLFGMPPELRKRGRGPINV